MLYRLSLLALCLGVLGCSGVVDKPEVAEPPVVVPEPEPEPPAEPEAPEPEPVDLHPEWTEGTVIEVAPLVALEPMDQVVLPEVEGGDEPITYSLLSLPDWLGLEFDPAERLLTGTPSRAGSHDLTYRAEDADGDQAQLTFPLEVLDPSSCRAGRRWVFLLSRRLRRSRKSLHGCRVRTR